MPVSVLVALPQDRLIHLSCRRPHKNPAAERPRRVGCGPDLVDESDACAMQHLYPDSGHAANHRFGLNPIVALDALRHPGIVSFCLRRHDPHYQSRNRIA